MRKNIFLLLAVSMGLCSSQLSAQENIGAKEIKTASPIVSADNSVSFNLVAPKANSVYLTGNWMKQTSKASPQV